MKSRLLGAVLGGALVLGATFTSNAMPMLVTNGSSQVTGVNGLVVGSTTFNVAFSAANVTFDQATVALGTSFDFGTSAAAGAAGTALVNFLNSQSPNAEAKDMFWGLGNNNTDHDIFLPFNITATTIDLQDLDFNDIAEGGNLMWEAVNFGFGISRSANFSPSISYSFAIFEQVPEPGTLAILGVGLAGLGFARRRKAAS